MVTLSEQEQDHRAAAGESSCDILRTMSFKPVDMSCSQGSYEDDDDEPCLSSPTSTIIFRDVSVDLLFSSSLHHHNEDINCSSSSSSSGAPSILRRANPIHDEKVVLMDELESDYHPCRVISPFASLENEVDEYRQEPEPPASSLELQLQGGHENQPVAPRLDYSRFFEMDLSSSPMMMMQHQNHHLDLLQLEPMGCDDFSLSSEEANSMKDHDEHEDDGIHDPAAFWEQGIRQQHHHFHHHGSLDDDDLKRDNDQGGRCYSPAQVSLQSFHDGV